MCGICGQLNLMNNGPVEREAVRRMTASLAHRGPDDEGYFVAGPVGLGFRRLSIIDLAGGHQPMSDAEGAVWVVFNGEVYNYRELRTELARHGHVFRTQSDTEVIIHAYKEWGTGAFDHLNGMFGLAIWDVRRGQLVLARDAMGIKPLYYRLADGRLDFGSEIRSLLAADRREPGIDPVALSLFLRFRYTPSPLTVFRGIRKLAPGTMLVCKDGLCREQRWYTYAPEPFSDKETGDAAEELLGLYRGAVKRHLISDVPVGVLLSGGLDSGLLLGLMNENGSGWPAYTAGYGSSFQDDEMAEAVESASLFGARHVPVRLDRAAFERTLPEIVACLEEPVASSSIVPMYFISQRARQDVKVALMGQGPDELFGGYKRHLGVHYGNRWRQVPKVVRMITNFAVEQLPRNETLKRGVRALDIEDRFGRYQAVFSMSSRAVVGELFIDGLLPVDDPRESSEYWEELLPQMRHLDELGGFQLLEVRSSLPDELLMYADKLSMAHGLEVRVPYLDRTVVEYAQRLDASFKIRNGTGKWLHRLVSRNYLPAQILKRKKRGFAVNVVDQWLRSSTESDFRRSLLEGDSLIFDLLKPEAVRTLVTDHRTGRQDNHKLLFSLVMLEQWLRAFRSKHNGTVG